MSTATGIIYVGYVAEADTLVVENGTGKANAESYGSLSEADEYLACGPYADAWDALTVGEQICLAKSATRFLDTRFRFYGQALTCEQALQWPRTKNYDEKGCIIPSGTIPQQLKEAEFELMGAFAADPDALIGIIEGAGAAKSWATDGLSIAFDVGATSGAPEDPEMGNSGAILGDRYINVEFNLRSIGTLKSVNWLQGTKQSVVRR